MSCPRFRNFCFISYSFIDIDFNKFINEHSICFFSYILHDRDVKEGGELKESHFHTVVRYKNPVTVSRALTDLKSISIGTVLVEVCQDLPKSVDYLIHKNDTDKYQYSLDDVHTYGDFVVKTLENIDNNTEFILNLFDFSPIEMARKYGRDYIKNFNSYNSFKERFKNIFDSKQFLEKNEN